jgi:hypothetical protein
MSQSNHRVTPFLFHPIRMFSPPSHYNATINCNYFCISANRCDSSIYKTSVRVSRWIWSNGGTIIWWDKPKYSDLRLLQYHVVHHKIHTLCPENMSVRGGAEKSLARPTSPCSRAESIVSLERGVCSCAELQDFSWYRGWMEACQATRAISTTSGRELSSGFFLARQGA